MGTTVIASMESKIEGSLDQKRSIWSRDMHRGPLAVLFNPCSYLMQTYTPLA